MFSAIKPTGAFPLSGHTGHTPLTGAGQNKNIAERQHYDQFQRSVQLSDEQQKITDAFCSEETANNKEIFADPSDENAKAIFEKDSDKTCFVKCDDAWYNPIRELGA